MAHSIAMMPLQIDPKWTVPPPEQLIEAPVDGRFLQRLKQVHRGLKDVHLHAEWDTDDGIVKQKVATIRIKGAGANKIPPISGDELAQIIYLRAEEHARQLKTSVRYKCDFAGENDDLGVFQKKRGSFQIDGASLPPLPAHDEDDDSDDDSDDTRSDHDEHFARSANGDWMPRLHRSPDVQETGVPFLPSRLPESVDSETVMLLRMTTQHTAGLLAELRASLAQVRLDLGHAMREQREESSHIVSSVLALVKEMRVDLGHSREEASKANRKLAELAMNTTNIVQQQQEAVKQGWDVFQAGMQMQLQSLQQNMSWERQMMFMQFDQMAKEQSKKKLDFGWAKQFAPLLVALAGQILSGRGSRQGDVLQDIARQTIGQNPFSGDEGSDEEEEDEPVMGIPPGVSAQEHFQKNPLCALLHLLNQMLSREQRTQIDKLVPDAAQYFDQALSAVHDEHARNYVIQFYLYVQSSGKGEEVLAVFTSEQRALFEDIQAMILGGSAQDKDPIDVEAKPVEKKRNRKNKPPEPPEPPEPPVAEAE